MVPRRADTPRNGQLNTCRAHPSVRKEELFMSISKEHVKIALLSFQKDTQRIPPVGLVYLATYLRDRVGLPENNIKVFENYFFKNIESELRSFQPDIIGFTAMSVNYGETIRFARQIREQFSCPFILGGVHISTLPESLDPIFDVGVLGEGEIALHDLLNVFFDKQSLAPEFVKNIQSIVYRVSPHDLPKQTMPREPIANLDELPFPDFKFVHAGFFAPEEIPAASSVGIKAYVLSSRGCPYRCTFCSTSRFWGKMRFHSPDYTARLVQKIVNDFGADYLWTLDDLFTVSPKRIREIREALIKYGVFDQIKGSEFTVRANLVTDELCEELKRINVIMVNFGFESGSDRVLNTLKAGSVSVEQNRQAILLCKKHGITIYGSLMYGVPNETLEDMDMTNDFIDFAIRNGARNIWSFVAAPYPGTPFWDIAVQRGKVSNNMDWSRLGCHNPRDPLLLDESVDRNEFVRVFNKGRKKLRYLKIRLILDFLLKNPLLFLRMILHEPMHYISSALTWVMRQ